MRKPAEKKQLSKAGKPKTGAKQARKMEPKPGAAQLAPEPKKAKAELDPAEWDFSGIPPEELPACFLWEYARESEWLLDLSKRCVEHPLHTEEGERYFEALERKHSLENPEPDIEIPEWRDDFQTPEGNQWMEDLVKISSAVWPGYVDRNFRFLLSEWIQDGIILTPWQYLQDDQKKTIIIEASQMDEACRKPFLTPNDFESQDSIFYDNGKKLKGRLLLDPRNILQGFHVFKISWETHTNKQLLEAFSKWLKDNRPPEISEPLKHGDKTEDRRAWLQWLGAMRALSHSTFKHPRFPQKLRQLGERRVYDMRKKAREKFQDAFRFLPAPIEPRSFRTSANVSPPER